MKRCVSLLAANNANTQIKDVKVEKEEKRRPSCVHAARSRAMRAVAAGAVVVGGSSRRALGFSTLDEVIDSLGRNVSRRDIRSSLIKDGGGGSNK